MSVKSLPDALADEILRVVTDVMPLYLSLGGAAMPALYLMGTEVERGVRALASMDVQGLVPMTRRSAFRLIAREFDE